MHPIKLNEWNKNMQIIYSNNMRIKIKSKQKGKKYISKKPE